MNFFDRFCKNGITAVIILVSVACCWTVIKAQDQEDAIKSEVNDDVSNNNNSNEEDTTPNCSLNGTAVSGYFPDHNSKCKFFFFCHGSLKIRFECPDDYRFDQTVNGCQREEIVPCVGDTANNQDEVERGEDQKVALSTTNFPTPSELPSSTIAISNLTAHVAEENQNVTETLSDQQVTESLQKSKSNTSSINDSPLQEQTIVLIPSSESSSNLTLIPVTNQDGSSSELTIKNVADDKISNIVPGNVTLLASPEAIPNPFVPDNVTLLASPEVIQLIDDNVGSNTTIIIQAGLNVTTVKSQDQDAIENDVKNGDKNNAYSIFITELVTFTSSPLNLTTSLTNVPITTITGEITTVINSNPNETQKVEQETTSTALQSDDNVTSTLIIVTANKLPDDLNISSIEPLSSSTIQEVTTTLINQTDFTNTDETTTVAGNKTININIPYTVIENTSVLLDQVLVGTIQNIDVVTTEQHSSSTTPSNLITPTSGIAEVPLLKNVTDFIGILNSTEILTENGNDDGDVTIQASTIVKEKAETIPLVVETTTSLGIKDDDLTTCIKVINIVTKKETELEESNETEDETEVEEDEDRKYGINRNAADVIPPRVYELQEKKDGQVEGSKEKLEKRIDDHDESGIDVSSNNKVEVVDNKNELSKEQLIVEKDTKLEKEEQPQQANKKDEDKHQFHLGVSGSFRVLNETDSSQNQQPNLNLSTSEVEKLSVKKVVVSVTGDKGKIHQTLTEEVLPPQQQGKANINLILRHDDEAELKKLTEDIKKNVEERKARLSEDEIEATNTNEIDKEIENTQLLSNANMQKPETKHVIMKPTLSKNKEIMLKGKRVKLILKKKKMKKVKAALKKKISQMSVALDDKITEEKRDTKMIEEESSLENTGELSNKVDSHISRNPIRYVSYNAGELNAVPSDSQKDKGLMKGKKH